jgi:hypothetical protein
VDILITPQRLVTLFMASRLNFYIMDLDC